MVRPFSESAQVTCRCYSLPLQRVISDFGADVAFTKVPEKLKEHHGIDVPISSARAITQSHAEKMHQQLVLEETVPAKAGVSRLVAEMDGTSIPIVETVEQFDQQGKPIDRRTTRQTQRKEARLCMVRPAEQRKAIFGATLGSTDEAGDHLLDCAIRCGMGRATQIHGCSDGAPWISNQMERVFGAQSHYLLDFYHVSEYLADAADTCASTSAKEWFQQQQQRLKNNNWQRVLNELKPYLEASNVDESEAPVRQAYRYLKNHSHQLDYQAAIAAELPIGSGEIESAHRYVILERLEIAGAWWTQENAQNMLTMRVQRENQQWDDYWDSFSFRVA